MAVRGLMGIVLHKKHALVGLLMLIAVIPPVVPDSWGQAVGGGSPQWTFETIKSKPPVSDLDALSLTIVPSGDDQIPAVAFTQGGKTLRFAARTASGETPWVNEEPLTGSSFTFVRDLALVADGSGVINLVYYHDLSTDTLAAGLGFLRKSSLADSWPAPTFVGGETGKLGNGGQYVVSSVDSTGNFPCVAYRRSYGSPANGLFYSCYDTAAATWSLPIPTAVTTSGINSFIAFGMGSGSRADYAYTRQSGGSYSLLYGSRAPDGRFGTTALSAIGLSATDNFYKDLFMADDLAHIFYYDPIGGDLKYGLQQNSGDTTLSILTVDNGGAADVGQYVSAARCPNGSAHLSYYDATNRALKYARCLDRCDSAAKWSVSTVDPATPSRSTINRGQYSRIACDANDVVHIAYYDATASQVKYAVPRICGNGIREGAEVCDDGNVDACTGTCNATCAATVMITGCGDGVRCGTEQCDDGNGAAGDGCDASCQQEGPPICGNNIVQAPEVCDDGNQDVCVGNCNADCTAMVTITGCGDGVLCNTEQCDDGNRVAGDGCSDGCQREPSCGDGACNGTESCTSCIADCGACAPICGNGIREGAEICDDGNTDNCLGACKADCTIAVTITGCGDGIICGVEACDDGNMIDDDGCTAGCQVGLRAGACGNGVVDPGESCDDGDQMDCDGCRGDCSARETGCGDRFVCGMEQCDDGNMTDGDGCSGLCTNEGIRVLACGDGILQAGEECDDGNVTAGDGCNSTCRTEATPLSSKKTICHQAEEKDQAKPGNDGRSCWKIK